MGGGAIRELIKRSPPPGVSQSATPAPGVATPLPRSCLLVDDSRVVRGISRRIMERFGYSVTEAENGEEALGKCRVTMPDVILLDWNMPVMSGIDFLAALRGIEAGAKPKVVFCTTNSDEAAVRSGIEAGAGSYVLKPFDERTLRIALERLGEL
jgi:two-component system chemotaxis response regulator CheY